MIALLRNARAYAEIKAKVCHQAEFECQKMDLLAEQILVEVFKKSNLSMTGNPIMGNRRARLRAPGQLRGVIDALLSYSPVLSAWLVRYHIVRALKVSRLPIHLQGDIMMALENANYVLPEKIRAEAQLLAYSLCMLPTLGWARATLFGLGTPLNERPVPPSEFEAAVKAGFLPQDVISTGENTVQLGWNCEMRANVADALEYIDPRLSSLMKLEKFRRVKKRPLKRRGQELDEDAVKLLRKGIDLAGGGDGEKKQAFEMLEKAGKKESSLLPDVLRNQAWILSKQGDRTGAVSLARKALDLAPDYAEVWYAMGIDLGAMGQYEEALQAYQKAKKLGHRSKGLEHNIAVCKRACSGR